MLEVRIFEVVRLNTKHTKIFLTNKCFKFTKALRLEKKKITNRLINCLGFLRNDKCAF